MSELLEMTLENFMAYRERAVIPLARRGLVLLRGDVRVSAATDSNGAGKTAVPSALSWGLYGEALDGRRGADVACRFTRGACRVTVTARDGDYAWRVTRTARPTSLAVEHVAPGGEWVPVPDLLGRNARDVQPWIDARLGYGFRTFRNAVIFDRFERFAQAEQSEQLRMLDEIQGVDFLAARTRASDWRRDCVARIDAAATAVATSEERLTAARAREDAAAARSRDVAGSVNSTIADLRRRRAADTGRAADCRAQAATAPTDAAIVSLTAARTERLRLRADVDRAVAVLENFDVEVKRAIEALRAQRGRCQTCRQEITPRSRKAAVRAAIVEFAERRDTLAAAALACRRVFDLHVKRHGDDIDQLIAHAKALRTGAAALEREAAECDGRVAFYDRQIADAASAARAAAADLERAREDTEIALTARDAARAEGDAARKSLAIAEYWVLAFGDRGIRSALLDRLAPFIAERERAHLETLAAGEVDVDVSAFRELKGGGQREQLTHVATWDWGGTGRASGSAGQDRRVDLALFAALQDVAETWAARPFSLRVFDEPADALDVRGQELFVQWLRAETARRGTVILITHSQTLAALVDADETWIAVLDEHGSHFTVDRGGEHGKRQKGTGASTTPDAAHDAAGQRARRRPRR